MLGTFEADNYTDEDGNPSGGDACGCGFAIKWQNGPLGRGKDRIEPNGAFVETVIAAAKQRIEHYQEAQEGKFACAENESAIECLRLALAHLDSRTKEREAREVEGTHEV